MKIRHFEKLSSCTPDEYDVIINRAIASKSGRQTYLPARGKTLAMIFEKQSTRTRVSFETGFAQLGGHPLFLATENLQLGRGEPIMDTARVVSSMVDMIMIRTFSHDVLLEFASYSSVPVINGLTDAHHPCQLLADVMTFAERKGSIAGKKVAFIGDCRNNICNSYIEASTVFGFTLHLACPPSYRPLHEQGNVQVFTNPQQAVEGVHLVVTDVWASMGDESQAKKRLADFAGYQVTTQLLDYGNDPLFLHCLPAHRGEEVDEHILTDSRSGVWQASENRLHVQKSLMEFLLDVNG